MSQTVVFLAAFAAMISAMCGGIAWVAARMSSQTARFDRMEDRYNKLHREHTLARVEMERFRLAFQIVAAELATSNPASTALIHARALLADSFVFPASDKPVDMQHALDEIESKT